MIGHAGQHPFHHHNQIMHRLLTRSALVGAKANTQAETRERYPRLSDGPMMTS